MEQKSNSTSNYVFSGASGSISANYDGIIRSSGNTLYTGPNNPYEFITVKSNNMRQIKAALFSVIRDEKTNDIIEATFKQEFWFTQKPGISFELAAMNALGYVIDPETEIIEELYIVTF